MDSGAGVADDGYVAPVVPFGVDGVFSGAGVSCDTITCGWDTGAGDCTASDGVGEEVIGDGVVMPGFVVPGFGVPELTGVVVVCVGRGVWLSPVSPVVPQMVRVFVSEAIVVRPPASSSTFMGVRVTI